MSLLTEMITLLIEERNAGVPAEDMAASIKRVLGRVGTIDNVDAFDVSFRTRSGSGHLPPALKTRLETLVASAGWYFIDDGQAAFRGDQVLYTLHPNVTRKIVPGRFVYHVTTVENVANIMKTGLIPKASSGARHNTKYGPRVFVARKPPMTMNLGLNGQQVAVLQIDVAKAGVDFYEDPEFMRAGTKQWHAAYTFDRIPPVAITVVKTAKHRGV